MDGSGRNRALALLGQMAQACERCPLAASRARVVFGEGNPTADIAIVGEAPGAAEDGAGRPFVGAAGEALDQLLATSGLDRGRVYVTNTVKCRPPGNRTPTAAEVAACAPFLDLELVVVRPRVVVALGATAARRLTGIQHLAGAREADVRIDEATVVATYHPSPSGLNRERGRRDILVSDLRRVAQLAGSGGADAGDPANASVR